LWDLLSPILAGKRLKKLLSTRKTHREDKIQAYGDRTFRKAGSAIWNSLPDELRLETSVDIFKNKLKTLLFNQAYS
jgi:hypothetical protein